MTAKLEFSCGACGMALRLPGQYAGQKSRCPGCRGIVGVPRGVPGEIPVAPRLCNTCGEQVSAKDMRAQGLGEVFCRPCLDTICSQTDSSLLRQMGIEDLDGVPSDGDSGSQEAPSAPKNPPEQKTRVWRRSAMIPGLEPGGEDPFRPE